MNIQAVKRNEQGLTLVEVLAALIIISIVILGITAFFSTSVKTTDTTEKLLDASYVNQRFMEEIYQISGEAPYSPGVLTAAGWTKQGQGDRYRKESSGYYVELTISDSASGGSLRNILIRVYEDRNYTKLASQMETKRQWDDDIEENE